MLQEVANAITKQDYREAEYLLRQLREEASDSPWLKFYQVRLQEAKGDLERADRGYREILRHGSNPKIIVQARQGIARLEKIAQKERQLQVAQEKEQKKKALTTPGGKNTALLILKSLDPEKKKDAAQALGQIMGIDAYTARLQLPTRAWRLYRTGYLGELEIYAQKLQEADIPCLCVSLPEVVQFRVNCVQYFTAVAPQGEIIYETEKGKMASLSFSWEEINQAVEGLLPIFEECVEVGLRGKLQRKTKILDYAKFCDLHLPARKLIIRLCDQSYHFQEGEIFSPQQKSIQGNTTTRDNWLGLQKFLRRKLPQIPWIGDFTPFGETAIDFAEMLKSISPQINLLRREETPWDAAFELYSRLNLINYIRHKEQN